MADISSIVDTLNPATYLVPTAPPNATPQQQQQMYEALKTRQAIATAIAARRLTAPKTLGEGMTYLGEALGQRAQMSQLAQQEAAYQAMRNKGAQGAPPITQYKTAPAAAAPVPAPAPARPPSWRTPGTLPQGQPYTGPGSGPGDAPTSTGATADASDTTDDDTTESNNIRNSIALAMAPPPAAGVPSPNPTEAGSQAPEQTLSSDDGGQQQPDDQTLARRNAIGGMESGGQRDPYQTVVDTGTGDYVYGRYGIKGSNIPQWTQAALGQALSPQQFLADRDAQDTTFDHRMGLYADKYGEEGAGRAWYAGERGMKNLGNTDRFGRLTVAGYGQNYVNRLQGGGGPRGTQVASLNAAAGVNPSVPDDAADNPAITTDIAAAPDAVTGATDATGGRVQMAGGPNWGGPPADLNAPRVPATPAPQIGRFKLPYQRTGEPTPPDIPAPTPGQIWAMQILQTSDDPVLQNIATQRLNFEKGQQALEWQRRQEQYKAQMEIWKSQTEKEQEFARGDTARETTQQKEEITLQQAKEAAARSQRFGNMPEDFIKKQLDASYEDAKGIPSSATALANAKKLLLAGNMFTGRLADRQQDLRKLANAMGVPDQEGKASDTDLFQAMLARAFGQARKDIIGGRVTQYEMPLVTKASGGDIKLEPGAMLGIINELQHANRQAAITYHRNLFQYAGDEPNAVQTAQNSALPLGAMEQLVPDRHRDQLLAGRDTPQKLIDFDKSYHTPGLAQYILSHHPK
jgi:hypothetical protein